MKLIPIKTPVIKQGNFWTILDNVLSGRNLGRGDILVVASKVLSWQQGDFVDLDREKPTTRAKKLAKKFDMNPALVQIIIKQADQIIGGVKGVILTVKDNIVIANAGVDHSNAPLNQVILWPKKPTLAAELIRVHLEKKYKKRVGVIIADSRCHPRRLGTSSFALAIAGFEGVIDLRKKTDLAGRQLKITFSNLADSLAGSAGLLMGEAAEKIPLVLIKQSPIKISNKSAAFLTKKLQMAKRSCLFGQSDL